MGGEKTPEKLISLFRGLSYPKQLQLKVNCNILGVIPSKNKNTSADTKSRLCVTVQVNCGQSNCNHCVYLPKLSVYSSTADTVDYVNCRV